MCVFFCSRHFIWNSMKTNHSCSGEEDKTGLLICLFALMSFTKCFVFVFRVKLEPVGRWEAMLFELIDKVSFQVLS